MIEGLPGVSEFLIAGKKIKGILDEFDEPFRAGEVRRRAARRIVLVLPDTVKLSAGEIITKSTGKEFKVSEVNLIGAGFQEAYLSD